MDTRLISRYFGSKERLFAEVVDLAYEKSMMMTPEHNAEAARTLLTGEGGAQADGLLLTLRSASNPRAAAIMRDSIERNYQRRLADVLPGSDTTGRSALLIAICAGVLLNGHSSGGFDLTGGDGVLGPFLQDPPVVSMDTERGPCRTSRYGREEGGDPHDRTATESSQRHERPQEERGHDAGSGQRLLSPERDREQHEHRHHPHRQGVVAHRRDGEGRRARHDQSCPRLPP
ncbi:hypothetical protein SMALB_0513 [Streptomyces malaysiensis]|uniref:Tetracyclin repressor-like C-terminal domain-containing protein n=1 Tax=Streptomyces malaysiensis TaxID=92644 RepID=A0A7X5WX40_STRMQ|nr:hypothetical protein [Streptomyces malaysiensis]